MGAAMIIRITGRRDSSPPHRSLRPFWDAGRIVVPTPRARNDITSGWTEEVSSRLALAVAVSFGVVFVLFVAFLLEVFIGEDG